MESASFARPSFQAMSDQQKLMALSNDETALRKAYGLTSLKGPCATECGIANRWSRPVPFSTGREGLNEAFLASFSILKRETL